MKNCITERTKKLVQTISAHFEMAGYRVVAQEGNLLDTMDVLMSKGSREFNVTVGHGSVRSYSNHYNQFEITSITKIARQSRY